MKKLPQSEARQDRSGPHRAAFTERVQPLDSDTYEAVSSRLSWVAFMRLKSLPPTERAAPTGVWSLFLPKAGGSWWPPCSRSPLGRHEGGEIRNGPDALTTLEVEILQLASEGLSTKLIAQRLGSAPSTVSNHLNLIYAKLGAGNRAEAVAIAIREAMRTPASDLQRRFA